VTLTPDNKELAKTFIPEPREPITWEVPPLTVPAPEPIELPKTASPFPLLALVGPVRIGSFACIESRCR
jgi:hypothetical protein